MFPPILRSAFILILMGNVVFENPLPARAAEPNRPPVVKPAPTPPQSQAEAIHRLKAFGMRVFQEEDVPTIGVYAKGGDELLAAIAQNAAVFPKVKLFIHGVDQMTPKGLVPIGSLENLTELTFSETSITDAGIAQLTSLKQLIYLRLMHNTHPEKVTNQALKAIVTLPRLETLIIGNAAIDDEGLRILPQSKRLSWLWFHRTHISDAGLKHLKQVSTLKTLGVTPTLISETARQDLKSALPELKFDMEDTHVFWAWRSGRIRRGYDGYWRAFSRDGKWMLSASSSELHLFERPSGRYLRTLKPAISGEPLEMYLWNLAISPDGKTIAIGAGRDGRSVAILNSKTGEVLKQYQSDVSPEKPVSARMQSLVFSPDGKRLAACVEGRANVWDLKTGERIFTRPHYGVVRLSHDGQRLLLHHHSWVEIWDLKAGKMLGEHGGIDCAGFQKDGSVLAIKQLLLEEYDRRQAHRNAPATLIRVINLDEWKAESTIALAAEAGFAAFVCNNTVLILNLDTMKVEDERPLPADRRIESLQFSPDGELLCIQTAKMVQPLR